MAKNEKSDLMLDLLRQSRDRNWVISPITKIVNNKKKERNRKACRAKVVD